MQFYYCFIDISYLIVLALFYWVLTNHSAFILTSALLLCSTSKGWFGFWHSGWRSESWTSRFWLTPTLSCRAETDGTDTGVPARPGCTYSAHGINDGGGSVGLLAVVDPGLFAHQRPQLVQVDGGAVGRVPLQVVMSHTHLTEVPRVAEETQDKDQSLSTESGSDLRSAAASADLPGCNCPCGWLTNTEPVGE